MSAALTEVQQYGMNLIELAKLLFEHEPAVIRFRQEQRERGA